MSLPQEAGGVGGGIVGGAGAKCSSKTENKAMRTMQDGKLWARVQLGLKLDKTSPSESACVPGFDRT